MIILKKTVSCYAIKTASAENAKTEIKYLKFLKTFLQYYVLKIV